MELGRGVLAPFHYRQFEEKRLARLPKSKRGMASLFVLRNALDKFLHPFWGNQDKERRPDGVQTRDFFVCRINKKLTIS